MTRQIPPSLWILSPQKSKIEDPTNANQTILLLLLWLPSLIYFPAWTYYIPYSYYYCVSVEYEEEEEEEESRRRIRGRGGSSVVYIKEVF